MSVGGLQDTRYKYLHWKTPLTPAAPLQCGFIFGHANLDGKVRLFFMLACPLQDIIDLRLQRHVPQNRQLQNNILLTFSEILSRFNRIISENCVGILFKDYPLNPTQLSGSATAEAHALVPGCSGRKAWMAKAVEVQETQR